ncbi:MAG TPA: hypothetical protein VG369_00320, partial [Humibacter sp.]|nr:hypothetical protein [Humibacter sp.]
MKPLIGTTIRAMAIACAIALVGTALAFTAPPPARAATAGTTYYVDSQLGSDSNQGTSSSAPWKSLAKVNATTFRAGDRILLADGSEWSGTTLWPKGSGDATANVTIGDYGSGAQPRVDGAGQVANAVELFNQQYWTIENIEVTNDNPSAGADGTNLGDFRGIFVGGDDGQRLSGFTIDGVY